MKCVFAVLFLACAPACVARAALPASVSPKAPISQQEKNKAVARRVFEEILNQGRFDAASELYAPDFVNHGLHRDSTLKQDQDAAHWEKQAMPDMHLTVDKMVADGDMVTALWDLQGTNSHSAGWLPATGVRIEERGITIWRIADGRIHDEWTVFDVSHIIRQAVSQLMWQLLAVLAVMAVLLWIAIRLLVRLYRRFLRRSSPAPA